MIESDREIGLWYRQGLTYEDMADLHEEKYGRRPSLSTLNDARQRAGEEGRLVRDASLIPWRVKKEHRSHLELRGLQFEAQIRAGKTLTPYGWRIWRPWHEGLEASGLVIHYGPESGFSRVPRRKGIDLDLVHEPDKGDANGRASYY